MQVIISIRCGKNLRSRLPIHEYIFCGYSEKLQGVSVKAKDLREVYDRCEDILEQISAIAMTEVSSDLFVKRGDREKVGRYRSQVKSRVSKDCVAVLVDRGHGQGVPSGGVPIYPQDDDQECVEPSILEPQRHKPPEEFQSFSRLTSRSASESPQF